MTDPFSLAEPNPCWPVRTTSAVPVVIDDAVPASEVRWNEAARFVNWFNTSDGVQPAYEFSIQPGDAGYDPRAGIHLWEPPDPGYDKNNLFRNNLAHYVLPSDDKWYKAAFYDPNANGGAGGYWNYPTGNDSVPAPVASGTAPRLQHRPSDITQAGGLRPYGTMGLLLRRQLA